MAASWEDKAKALNLDDRTFQALRGVPSERVHQILDEVSSKTTEVRNPSAFVSKAARETWEDTETLRRCLEGSSWRDVLDDKAKEELLHGADPASAFALLEDLRTKKDDIRNPSSYVCSTMKKRAAEQQMRGGMARPLPGAFGSLAVAHAGPPRALAAMAAPMQWSAPSAFSMSAQMYAAQSMRAGAMRAAPVASAMRMPSASPPTPLPTREPTAEAKAEIDQAVAEMAPDLDQRAVEKIYQLASPALARNALEALAAKPDVRNKSAFLSGIVSRRLQEAAEAGQADEVDAKLQKWEKDLDEGAKKILTDLREKLGTEAMLEVLNELEARTEKGELRNISSFAFSMARQRLTNVGGGGAMPTMAYMAQQQMAQNYMQMPQMALVHQRAPSMLSAMQGMAPAARFPVASARPAAANSARWVQDQVARFGLRGKLDDAVVLAMESADADRVTEILEELGAREDVRNPSAFVSRSLKDRPNSRKRMLEEGMGMGGGPIGGGWGMGGMGGGPIGGGPLPGARAMSAGPLGGLGGSMSDGGWGGGAAAKRPRASGDGEQASGSYAQIMQRMDEAAQAKLRDHPDQNRVQEILKEMATSGREIRNPSAFVVRALNTNKA